MFLITPIARATQTVGVLIWDASLAFYNLVTPNYKVGHVVPEGHPGAGGAWPEYIPPKEGDSRCPCPALNAMANHGILPHDGRNISLSFFVPNYAANMLKKSYSKDTFDLAELNLHNGIEHDASLTRDDVYFQPDQGVPHLPFVEELLESPTGKDKDGNVILTPADLSRISSVRRADARVRNPEFSLDLFHKLFGSGNSSTMLTIFGGRKKDLETFLTEERFPEGWEPRILERGGLTMAKFNRIALRVEFGIDEKKVQVAPAADAASPISSAQGK